VCIMKILFAGLATLVVIAIITLQEWRVARTTVDLVAKSSALHLRLAETSNVLPALTVKEIEFFPPFNASIDGVELATKAQERLHLTTLDQKAPLSVNMPTLAASRVIEIRRKLEAPGKYELVLEQPVESIQTIVTGRAKLAFGEHTQLIESGFPPSIMVSPSNDNIRVTIQLHDKNAVIQQPISVAGLSFRETSLEATNPSMFSTLKQGSIRFEDLSDQVLHLRDGEPIEFNGVDGFIRKLTLEDEYISLGFSGEVSGLQTGLGENKRDLRPSQLEYLMGDLAFVAIASFLFAIIQAVFGAAFSMILPRGQRND